MVVNGSACDLGSLIQLKVNNIISYFCWYIDNLTEEHHNDEELRKVRIMQSMLFVVKIIVCNLCRFK